jgi:hypothetical protein
MSDKVGGYTGIKPGGARMDSDRVGGYTGTKPGGDKAVIKSIKPGG